MLLNAPDFSGLGAYNIYDKFLKAKSGIRHGFVRGTEPYNYVRDIFLRYEHYKQFIKQEATI